MFIDYNFAKEFTMGGQVMCFVKGIEAILFSTILKFLLFFSLFTKKNSIFVFLSVEQREW